MIKRYRDDVIAWAREQAHLLRTGQFALLDIEHLADEIEDVAKAEQRELFDRMAALICNLLSCPDPTQRNWLLSVRKQRNGIIRRIENAQSLKSLLSEPDWWVDVWDSAVVLAVKVDERNHTTFPDTCPWSPDQILDPNFIPQGLGQ